MIEGQNRGFASGLRRRNTVRGMYVRPAWGTRGTSIPGMMAAGAGEPHIGARTVSGLRRSGDERSRAETPDWSAAHGGNTRKRRRAAGRGETLAQRGLRQEERNGTAARGTSGTRCLQGKGGDTVLRNADGEAGSEGGGGLFRAIADGAKDAFILVDDRGAIVYMNPSGEELLGYAAEEVKGRSLHELLIPERYREGAAKAFEAMARGGGEGVSGGVREFTALRRNGVEFPLEVSVSSCSLEGRRYYFAICRDLSERKRLEKELHGYRDHLEALVKSRTQRLREMAEHYRSLVETSPDCIVLTDLGGEILMINRSGVRLFGYEKAEEMLGRSVLDLFPPEERQRARASMRTRAEGESVRNDVYELLRRDGSRFHAEVSASLMRDAEGKPVGFVSVTRDISDRRRAEERLRKINRCFLGLGPDPLENMQRLAQTAREVLEADMARYTRKYEEGVLSFSTLRPGEGFAAVDGPADHLCSRLLSTGMAGPLTTADLDPEALAGDPDVRERGLRSCLLHPVRAHGETVGCLTVMCAGERAFSSLEKDTIAAISRALGIEEERFAYEESLRDFVDVASHELRHPVALLAGFAETLAESGEEMDGATRREVAGAISQASQRLTAIARDLLEVSLAERDRFSIHRSQGNLAALVEAAAREMRERLPGAAVTTRSAEDLGPLSFDAERIRSLLVILVENAHKFAPPGSDIEVSVEAGDGGALVSVMDRGVGIAEEHRQRIFERFYQVEEAQHHSRPGLGLGLYLARRIVEAHGGRIWHEPREGGGSVFRFTLPAP